MPIPLTGEIHSDVSGTYRIVSIEHGYYDLQQNNNENKWGTRLRFNLNPKKLIDFKEPCHFNQSSPESNFTKRELATIATEEGRVTFSDHKLIITHQNGKDEKPIQSEEKLEMFKTYFGISIAN